MGPALIRTPTRPGSTTVPTLTHFVLNLDEPAMPVDEGFNLWMPDGIFGDGFESADTTA